MNEEQVRAEAQASPLSRSARILFSHLPDTVVDALCASRPPPHYYEFTGRTALLAPRAVYVLDDDQVLCVRAFDAVSSEIITYRHKQLLSRALIDDDTPSEQKGRP